MSQLMQSEIARLQLQEKRCWMFDMDGTLTHAIHDFDAIREELGLPASVPILEALLDLPVAEADEKRRQLDELEFDIAAQATAQSGAHELLQHLSAKGSSLGIVTRNGKAIAVETLKACGLIDYFITDSIISRDCCLPKPAPAGVQFLLSRWSANNAESVMVGDYLFDLEAGRNAGVTTVHMDVSGEFSWPEYTDVGVTSLVALTALLD